MTTIINLYGGPGLGKAQPLHSKVLTPTGWVKMGDIVPGSIVITPSGEQSTVLNVTPQGEKDIYTVTFHDGSSAEACLDHLWECWYVPKFYNKQTRSTNKRSEKAVLSTREIIHHINRPNHGSFKFNVSIPIFSPTINNEGSVELPIPPYLLGCLIGDGSFVDSTPRLTSADDIIISQCNELVQEGYSISKLKTTKYDHTLSQTNPINKGGKIGNLPNAYATTLKELELFGHTSITKFIPEIYKQGSGSQRLSIIKGLMDTDGTVDKKGCCSFSTSSIQLAEDVQELLWSLGAICSIVSKKSPFYRNSDGEKVHCNTSYTIHFNAIDKSIFFSLDRKKDRITPTNPVSLRRKVVSVRLTSTQPAQCISIDHPSRLYVTDDYVVTHNSTTAAGLFHHMKCKQHSVELVTEYAKDMVWENRLNIMDEQLYIFAKQHRRVSRLVGKVDFVIVDSPLLMCCAYINEGYYNNLEPLVVEVFNNFNNINFVLERQVIDYEDVGRVQTSDEAVDKDIRILELLEKYHASYEIVKPRSPSILSDLYSHII